MPSWASFQAQGCLLLKTTSSVLQTFPGATVHSTDAWWWFVDKDKSALFPTWIIFTCKSILWGQFKSTWTVYPKPVGNALRTSTCLMMKAQEYCIQWQEYRLCFAHSDWSASQHIWSISTCLYNLQLTTWRQNCARTFWTGFWHSFIDHIQQTMMGLEGVYGTDSLLSSLQTGRGSGPRHDQSGAVFLEKF